MLPQQASLFTARGLRRSKRRRTCHSAVFWGGNFEYTPSAGMQGLLTDPPMTVVDELLVTGIDRNRS